MKRTKDALLEEARHCRPGQWLEITVSDLLSAWGHRVRNHDSVLEIQMDLDRAGLTTQPSFSSGHVRTSVRLVPAEQAEPWNAEEVADASAGSANGEPTEGEPDAVRADSRETEDEDEPTEDDAAQFPQVSLLVGDLPSATNGVGSVRPDDPLEKAHALMMRHYYSQLAVLRGRRLLGAVSWQSIAHAQVRGAKAKLVADVTDQFPEVVRIDSDLLQALPQIVERDYVFVRDRDERVCGIVTTADLSKQFDYLARPYFLVGEVERRLRRHLHRCFTTEDIRRVAKKATTADDLMFGHYCELLKKDQNWGKLAWEVDKQIFIDELDQVRQTRNDIMHFRPEPLDEEKVRQLVGFAKWLRHLDPMV